MPRPLTGDYDRDPDRFRAGVDAVAKYSVGDVHPDVAERFMQEGLSPTLDLGCGEGRLATYFRDEHSLVGLDYSATMLQRAPAPRLRGDGSRLPFADGSFKSVAALWCLYHFTDVQATLREAYRVLAPGGLFAASASARNDDPELAPYRTIQGSTFDAEEAEEIVAAVFDAVEVERWDGPFVNLPDDDALRVFLRGRGMSPEQIEAAMKDLETPLRITKRGCLVYGYKR